MADKASIPLPVLQSSLLHRWRLDWLLRPLTYYAKLQQHRYVGRPESTESSCRVPQWLLPTLGGMPPLAAVACAGSCQGL
jgi:hypothetical protein